MPNMEEQTTAMTNRSLRTIRTELEYLTDARIITPTQLSSILAQLPAQTPLHAPLPSSSSSPVPTPTANLASHLKSSFLSPSSEKKQTPINEKSSDFFSSQPTPAAAAIQPPPAYSHQPSQSLASASALYEYTPSDAGDLALLPNDRITITEFMNADWAKGRNERTGAEGIFPRSYVQILDEKNRALMAAPVPTVAGSSSGGYGNVPMEVSQTGGSGGGESKFNQHGKKFGKKMGNAAIFGAGATIGSNIVNGIF